MDNLIIILCALAAGAAVITAIICLISLISIKRELAESKRDISSIKSDALSAVNEGIKNNSEILQSSLRVYGEQVNTLSTGLDTRMENLRKNQDERLEAVRVTLDRNAEKRCDQRASRILVKCAEKPDGDGA